MTATIPESLAAFFQEYDMLTLDLEAHRELIIERTLSAGNLNELRWLFTCYPRAANFEIMLLESLTNFDNAERDLMPRLSTPLDWEQIKASFVAEARRLADKWLE